MKMVCEKKVNAIVLTITLLGLILCSNLAHAATYTVGDAAGWSFGIAGWENGKCFKAGDTLVFNYNKSAHNVVVADKASYDSCFVPENGTTFRSGNDRITLCEEPSYYICGVPGHCGAGLMKIAIKIDN